MIPVLLERARLEERSRSEAVAALEGLVLLREVSTEAGATGVRKGTVLDRDTADRLMELPWEDLHVLRLEEDDLHETEAGERLARAAAGRGIEVGSFSGGHWPLRSRTRGILEVRVEALDRVNAVEGLSVYAHLTGRIVDAGEIVARAKVIPFAVAGGRVREAEARAGEAEGLVEIRPFHPVRIAALVQESLGESALDRFNEALREKVAWFGSVLASPRVVPPEPEALEEALGSVLGQDGTGLVIVAGSKAMDPLDPAFRALEGVGATMLRHGVPAHPGSLLWLARRGDVPVLGMPTCSLFSRATVFDLVLARILGGLPVGAGELAGLGHGGFLTRDMAWRFPPYRKAGPRGEVE